MTPEQKVKILILALDARWQQKEAPDDAAHRPEFREPPAHEDNLMQQTQVVASSGPGMSQISFGVSA